MVNTTGPRLYTRGSNRMTGRYISNQQRGKKEETLLHPWENVEFKFGARPKATHPLFNSNKRSPELNKQ